MPLSKLTLSADQDLIEQAKKLAAKEGTSVSAIFSRLLRAMTRARSSVDTTGPLTEKATGLIRLPSLAADDEILEAALAERYGIRK
jgi:hypothetical protein